MSTESHPTMGMRTERDTYLPSEIWPHVLVKLPLQTLIVCGCVCKSWRSLFHSYDAPDFASRHLTPFNKNPDKIHLPLEKDEGYELVRATSTNTYLLQELWMEVLARLPVRSLLRFRCVCKSWRSIIDEPSFASMHLTLFNKNRAKTRFLTIERRSTIEKITSLSVREIIGDNNSFEEYGALNLTREGHDFGVISSANGLLLMERTTSCGSRTLELWNPFTRKSLEIRSGPIHVAYNIESSASNAGFGFDPSSNDIKVIAYAYRIHNIVAVYSVRSATWSTKCVDLTRTWYFKSKPLFARGALHLLACVDMENPLNKVTHVMSFHLDTETFSFTELPPEGQRLFPLLVGGSLAVIDVSNNISSHVWVLIMQQHKLEKHYSWTKCYSIYLPLTTYGLIQCPYFSHRTMSLFIDMKTQKLLVFVTKKPEMLSYNIENHKIEWLRTSDIDPATLIISMTPYVESLLLNQGLMCTP